MPPKLYAIIVVCLLSAAGVLADTFLKIASSSPRPILTKPFLVGFAIVGATTFGWVYALKHLKLAQVGVIYSSVTLILLAAVGILWFKEALTRQELLGVALAAISILLMSRIT